jgi:nucleolar GTP-binding protein
MRNSEKLNAGHKESGAVTGRLGELLKRIHVAQPLGGITREPFIPEAARNRPKYDATDPNRQRLERDLEEENGGAGVYNIDLKKKYLLDDDEWRSDKVPEVLNGKNVADYIDPDILSKLAALEEEEEQLQANGHYDGAGLDSEDEELEDVEEAEIRRKAELIREKRQLIRNESRMRKSLKNRAVIPRPAKSRKLSEMEQQLGSLGLDTTAFAARARSQSRSRSVARGRSVGGIDDPDAMDVDSARSVRDKSRMRSVSRVNRREDGVQNDESRSKAERLAKLSQKKMNRMARQGEADRHTPAALTKHLLAGKRGIGKAHHR